MTKEEISVFASDLGFACAWIEPSEIPVDEKFRSFCEENRCGNYNANYSCPPDCGSPDYMKGV